MRDKGIWKFVGVLFRGHSKKFWAAIVVILMGGTATAAVMAWEQPSNVGVTTSKASVSFSTVVQGVSTNANMSMLDINGHSYNKTNIGNFQMSNAGNGGTASIVHVNAGGFLPGDYVQFKVTITNTGQTTLLLNSSKDNLSITDYFLNSQGNFMSGVAINGQVSGNTSYAMSLFGNDSLADYLTYLDVNPSWSTNWVNDWGNLSGPMPMELAHGQSFTYYLYIGLGANASYNLPNQYFSLSLPLPPAR